jgi:hypothetical protein
MSIREEATRVSIHHPHLPFSSQYAQGRTGLSLAPVRCHQVRKVGRSGSRAAARSSPNHVVKNGSHVGMGEAALGEGLEGTV